MHKGKLRYRTMQLRYCARRILYRAGKDNYLPQGALSRGKFNSYIEKLLDSDEPFMVCGFGSQEARATARALGVERGYDRAIPKYVQRRMTDAPGFFPADDANIRRFGLLMAESAKQLDALAYWNSFVQEWLFRKICPDGVTVSYLENLEPCRNQDNPWPSSLMEKRVLVVYPFACSIESQYSKREKLFDNSEVLPEFELQTLVPPQTIAGTRDSRFSNWFEAFDWLCVEVDKRHFNIAMIGCGAYGFPLAAHVKKSGRFSIHGGMVQMLFGIKGRRWDIKPISKELYNEFRIRPSAEEQPENVGKVESGCYW